MSAEDFIKELNAKGSWRAPDRERKRKNQDPHDPNPRAGGSGRKGAQEELEPANEPSEASDNCPESLRDKGEVDCAVEDDAKDSVFNQIIRHVPKQDWTSRWAAAQIQGEKLFTYEDFLITNPI